MEHINLAQNILDMFPDNVSQFGLLGCGLFCMGLIGIVLIMRALWVLREQLIGF